METNRVKFKLRPKQISGIIKNGNNTSQGRDVQAECQILNTFHQFDFLGQVDIKANIGAMSTYSEFPNMPFELFMKIGDVSVAVQPLWAVCGC